MADYPMPQSAALLLEGGALRGVYTSGALDVFMENDIYFPTVAGVSAGALNAVNYVSRQPGRSARINLSYRHDPRYIGPLAVLNGGGVFGLEFITKTLAESEHFDRETFAASTQDLYVIATDIATGRAVFFNKTHCTDFDHAVIASASMPLASLPVRVEGMLCLDGGCSCPIPVQWAVKRSFEKIVIITTRPKGFRKEPTSRRMVNLYGDMYGNHTRFYASLLTMDMRYNALMDEMDELEQAGRAFILRPSEPITIGRFEGNTDKLLDLVNMGRRDAENAMQDLKNYLGQHRTIPA